MAPAVQKITQSSSRDISLNKLILSQSNVRRVKAGVSIEDLAADIARRGCLLQSLNVRAVLDADGGQTGMFEVPAGGRRFKALQLLVKQKRLGKTAPVPCVVRDPSTEILTEDDCLPRMSSAPRYTRSTSSAHSRPCARRASPKRTSLRPSSSA
jgi:ParB family transcriptional regulator, chromosome partitioning protein